MPPETGALTWIDTFTLPAKGEADDAAYKWINFVLREDIVPLMSASTGSIIAVKGGLELLPPELAEVVTAAFTQADLDNLKYLRQHSAGDRGHGRQDPRSHPGARPVADRDRSPRGPDDRRSRVREA